MEMFNVGGLKDEGGTKDPVSGNDVPSGSLKEEVRDDIDAKLSSGEFVFSADVTRFLGLRFLMELRDKAKAGLQRMEDMGQMGNSEEAVLDEDVPFEQSDLIIVAGSPMEEQMNKMNRGGMPIRASNGTAVPGRGDQLLGSNLRQYFNPTTNEVRSVLVSRDNLTGELKPVSPLEEGFILDTPENRTKSMQPQSQQTSARVETARPKTEKSSMPGGPDIGDIGVSEMTMSERADVDIPESVRGMVKGVVSMGVAGLGGVLGNVGQEVAKKTGMIDTSLRDLVAKGIDKDFKAIDEAKAAMKAMTPAQRAAQRARDEQTISERATRDYMDRVGASQEMRDDTKSVMGTIGGIKGPLSVDMVTGVVTDPLTGDVIGGRDADKARKSAGFGSDPTAPDVAGGVIGAGSAPGRGAGTQTPSKAGAAGEFGGEPGRGSTGTMGGGLGGPAGGPQSAGDVSGPPEAQSEMPGDEFVSGGLATKPKKKKQKKKRSGLASR